MNSNLPRIDLYSDTATRPTLAMREAMASAEVGDEQRHEDATVSDLMLPTGLKLEHGWQTLPNLHDMDGFYYCLLIKAG